MDGRTGVSPLEAPPTIDWKNVFTARRESPAAPAARPAPEPLARNGYALFDDVETPRVRELLAEMERFQAGFMAATRPIWKDGAKHTGDRLDNWSRRWEYPYCGWNLRDVAPGRLLDAGAGINFFAHWLAARGWDVTAADTNAALAPLYARAAEALPAGVRFERASIVDMPFTSETFDAITCVSVLEHAPRRVEAISEFARVLVPGGRLVLTWDVNLSRDGDIRLEDVAALLAELEKHFEPVHPLDLHRPANLLTTERMLAHERWRLPWRQHPAWWRRTLSRWRHGDPFRALAVMGTSWTKRG